MENFIFYAPTKIYFGKNAIKDLKDEAKNYGKRVLLTYGGGSVMRNGSYDDVINQLKDFEVFELSGIQPNPRIESVYEGIKICRENNIDMIIALGGGSVIDCSKVIAAGYYYENDAWDLVMDNSKITKALPLISILTMAATGSEMNANSVISNMDLNIKKGTSSPCMLPKASFLDATYSFSLPKYQTAAGIADIMSHIFENYFQKTEAVDIQDNIAEGLLKTCIKYGPIAIENPNNYEARSNIMWASSLALNGLIGKGKSGAWTCHAIEHELSAYYDITHGAGLAIITPAWMDYILSDETVDRFYKYGKNVFNIDKDDKYEVAKEAIKATRDFFKSLNLPSTLHEENIDESKLELMANMAYKHGSMEATYVPLKAEDILEILKSCK